MRAGQKIRGVREWLVGRFDSDFLDFLPAGSPAEGWQAGLFLFHQGKRKESSNPHSTTSDELLEKLDERLTLCPTI